MLREDQALWVDFGVLWNRYDKENRYMGYSAGHTEDKQMKIKITQNLNKRGKGSPDWIVKLLIPEEIKVEYFEKGLAAIISYMEKNNIAPKRKVTEIMRKELPDGTIVKQTESEQPGEFIPFKK